MTSQDDHPAAPDGAATDGQIQEQICYWINCSDCGDACWDDGEVGLWHFPSVDELRRDLVKHLDWTFEEHGRALCARCTERADCARDGHQYSEWKPLLVTGPDDPCNGIVCRSCNHCSDFEETLAALLEGEEF